MAVGLDIYEGGRWSSRGVAVDTRYWGMLQLVGWRNLPLVWQDKRASHGAAGRCWLRGTATARSERGCVCPCCLGARLREAGGGVGCWVAGKTELPRSSSTPREENGSGGDGAGGGRIRERVCMCGDPSMEPSSQSRLLC